MRPYALSQEERHPRDQVGVEFRKIERRYVLHALECAGCGHVARAPRRGIVPMTILSPGAVVFAGSLKQHCHATAGQVRGAFGDALVVKPQSLCNGKPETAAMAVRLTSRIRRRMSDVGGMQCKNFSA